MGKGISIDDLISDSFKGIFNNFPVFLVLGAMYCGGVILFSILMICIGIISMVSEGLMVVCSLILLILFGIYICGLNGAIIKTIANWKMGSKVTILESLTEGFKNSLKICGVYIIKGSIFIIPTIVLMLMLLAVFFESLILMTGQDFWMGFEESILVLLLLTLGIIIINCILSFLFYFIMPAIVVKNIGVFKGIGYGVEFYKGRLWALVGRILLIGLITNAIGFAMQVILGIVGENTVLTIILSLIFIPLSAFIYSFELSASTILFIGYDKGNIIPQQEINCEEVLNSDNIEVLTSDKNI